MGGIGVFCAGGEGGEGGEERRKERKKKEKKGARIGGAVSCKYGE
jgi:hypothetical protein